MARSTSASSTSSARSLSGAARLLAAALAAASAAALYESGDGVLQIASEKDWNDKVIKAPGLFLVECASAPRARAARAHRRCAASSSRNARGVHGGFGALASAHAPAGWPAQSLARSLAPPIIAQSTRRGAATARTWRPSGRR